MMTLLYLVLAVLAAAGFHLASAHQRFWPRGPRHASTLRAAGSACALLAIVAAIAALGPWAGVFAALTALMLGLVALPYLDAWLRLRQGRGDVG